MKKYNIVLLTGLLVIPLLGASAVYAVTSLSKNDEVALKQAMKPQNAERGVDLIGIFAPGFITELANAKTEYDQEYGGGNYKVIGYEGYTLIVPPTKTENIAKAKARVDAIIANEKSSTPTADIKASQIAQIHDVFGVEGVIVYNAAIGAYTDEKGFQYNFSNGELVNKQVGINSSLQTLFAQAYPHLQSTVINTAVITSEQAKVVSDKILDKLFDVSHASSLKNNVKYVDLGNSRVGITYGDMEVQMLVDKATGDVIHYSKVK